MTTTKYNPQNPQPLNNDSAISDKNQETSSSLTIPNQQVVSELRVLRIKDVTEKLAIGKSTLYDWLKPTSPRYDAQFPKPIKLSSKSIGWLSSEIDNWLRERVKQSRGE